MSFARCYRSAELCVNIDCSMLRRGETFSWLDFVCFLCCSDAWLLSFYYLGLALSSFLLCRGWQDSILANLLLTATA